MSYCHIVAPVDGIVNQRSAEVGARTSQGQRLIVVVQIDSVWANANFKETQWKKMHVGQRVTISVDSLGETSEGQIESNQRAMPPDSGGSAPAPGGRRSGKSRRATPIRLSAIP